MQFEDWACGKKLVGEYLRVSVCFYGDQPRFSSCTMSCRNESNPLPSSGTYLIQLAASTAGPCVTREVFFEKFSHILFFFYSYVLIFSLYSYILFFLYFYVYFIISYILIYKIVLFYYFNYISEPDGTNRSSLEYLRK